MKRRRAPSNKTSSRPWPPPQVKMGVTVILLGSESVHGKRRVPALLAGGWAMHKYQGSCAHDGGFSISRDGRSLNALVADLRWDDGIRVLLRLAADFPELPSEGDRIVSDYAYAVMSAVAEALVEP